MEPQPRQLFVNLAVGDLPASMAFFRTLGFDFDSRFTDVRTFTRRDLCDTTRSTEGLFALSCASRAEVDGLVETAIAAGGRQAMDPQDHGFMFARSFYDLDGHHWEAVWMDPNALQ